MKAENDSFERLVRSANRSPKAESVEPPFGLETRIIANWRSTASNGTQFVIAWLRGAAALSVVLAMLAAAWNRIEPTTGAVEETSLAETVIQTALNQ
jgi:hypothetical protein